MIINNDTLPSIVFVHPPRCSGTSIEKSLINGEVDDSIKHLKLSEMRNILGDVKYNNAFKFGIVRNPFDRVISMYLDPIYNARYMTLVDFLKVLSPFEWEHGLQCVEYIDDDVDYIIRYESRDNDIAYLNSLLCTNHNMWIDPTVHERKRPEKKRFQFYYNEESIRMVSDMFKDDIKKYNYLPEKYFGKQKT